MWIKYFIIPLCRASYTGKHQVLLQNSSVEIVIDKWFRDNVFKENIYSLAVKRQELRRFDKHLARQQYS